MPVATAVSCSNKGVSYIVKLWFGRNFMVSSFVITVIHVPNSHKNSVLIYTYKNKSPKHFPDNAY